MEIFIIAIKIFIFISIINVWFINFNKSTSYRGAGADSIKEEFKHYGLSENMVYVIGGLKVASATALVISIWVPLLVPYAAGLMAILMVGAIAMHIKINDPLKKSFPAFSFLVLSLILIANSLGYL